MSETSKLTIEAKALPIEERKRILKDIPEVELHSHLAELFRAMNSDYWVEVTHGADEYGKDLVIVRSDPLSPDTIAVVVKRGDIRARTSGDVDEVKQTAREILSAKGERVNAEIVSQIEQARDHEAVLKGFVRKLKVTKVIVVLVGDMSNNARERFEKELNGAGQVLDVAWLVEHFTQYYPQVFFEGRAIDYLDTLLQSLEQDSFYSKAGKTLSQCFVEPILARMNQQVSLDDVSLAVHLRNKRIRFSQLATAIGARGRAFLVGDAGSGKSKAVAKLCIDRYRAVLSQLTRANPETEQVDIPLLLTARRLQESTNDESLLGELFPEQVRVRFKISLIIVDGLDEVAGSEREALLNRAEGIATVLGASLLVTSRKLAAFSTTRTGYEGFELLPFEVGQALKLFEKVMTDVGTLPALHDGVQRIKAQLPMNPLSLLLLVELVTERKEVPSSITELYDRYLDLVFGRWDQEKGVEVLFEYVIKKRFLAALAYHEFHEKGRLEVPQSEFQAFLEQYARQYRWDDEKLRAFLKEIERAGVLEAQEDVFFKHRSFLDYFVALYIFEQRTSFEDLTQKVASTYYDGLWTEVTFFYTGLGREISSEVLDAIFEYGGGDTAHPIEKVLAGRLLQAGWHSTTAVKQKGVRRVLDHIVGAAAQAEAFLKKMDSRSPVLHTDMVTLMLIEHSLASVFVSQESTDMLEELEIHDGASREGLLRRASLLWALRRSMPSEAHQAHLQKFVKRIQTAGFDAISEARMLLLAAIADPSSPDLQKAVGRRLRRLVERTPGALDPLLPRRKKRIPVPRDK